MSDVVDAFGPDEVLREGALRCLPEISATLFAGKKQIGTIATCGTEGTLSLLDKSKTTGTFAKIDIKVLNKPGVVASG